MRPQDISDLESKAQEYSYNVTVKITADGTTTVTLKNKGGNVFEGKSGPRISDGYAKALSMAVGRMVAYVRRFE